MKSKKLGRFILFTVSFLILAPLVWVEGVSIYSYLQFTLMPSSTEQLLDFAQVPRNTELPRKNFKVTDAYGTDAYNTDYHPVENILSQRFPVGTPKQEIEKYSTKPTCRVGIQEITCSFNGVWYPPFSPLYLTPVGLISVCSDSVYLTFSFNTSDKLNGIKIFGSTNCV